MIRIPDQNVSIVMAERHLGKLSMPDLAVRALELGYDSRSLRMLAATLPSEPSSVIDDLYRRSVNELGWGEIRSDDYLIEYDKFVARGILADRIDAISGSKDLHRILYETDHDPLLHASHEIDEMIFSQEYEKKSGEKGYFFRSTNEINSFIKGACSDLLDRAQGKVAELPETTFEEAESYLEEFLGKCGLPKELVWLCLLDSLMFALPLISFIAFMSGTGRIGTLEWGSWKGKVVSLLGPFRSFNSPIDAIWVFGLIVGFIVIVRFGKPRVESNLFACGIVFLVISFVAPTTLFTVVFADIRVILPGLVLLALSFSASELPKWKYAFLLPMICIILARQASIAHGWIQVASDVEQQRQLLEKVEPESRIYPMFIHREGQPFERFEHSMEFVALYATVQRHSVLPTLYAIKGQQPLNFRNPEQQSMLKGDLDSKKPRCSLDNYDYVWAYGVDQKTITTLNFCADLIATHSKATVWKLR